MPPAALALALGAAVTAAPAVQVRGEGACPSAAALSAELARLLPGRAVTDGAAPPGAAEVRVRDLGGRYRVSAAGIDREAADPRRDCAERARAGAVLAALALEPPWLAAPPEAATGAATGAATEAARRGPATTGAAARPGEATGTGIAASPDAATGTGIAASPDAATGTGAAATGAAPATLPVAVRPPGSGVSPRRPAPRIELEVGAVAALSPRPGREQAAVGAFGGGLRLFVGGAHLGASLGAQGLSAVELALPGARARLLRVPFDLSLRALLRRGPVELDGEVGLLAAALRVEALELPGAQEPAAELRLELGLRLGLGLRLWAHRRLAPFLRIEGQVLPRPYDLLLQPGDALGQTPWLWLTGALGLAARLR